MHYGFALQICCDFFFFDVVGMFGYYDRRHLTKLKQPCIWCLIYHLNCAKIYTQKTEIAL